MAETSQVSDWVSRVNGQSDEPSPSQTSGRTPTHCISDTLLRPSRPSEPDGGGRAASPDLHQPHPQWTEQILDLSTPSTPGNSRSPPTLIRTNIATDSLHDTQEVVGHGSQDDAALKTVVSGDEFTVILSS